MPAIYVNNFLSWARARYVHINSGGSWISPRIVWVNNGGTWQRVFIRGTIASMTAGVDGGGQNFGYLAGSYGSMSSAGLNDGHTITGLSYNSFTSGTSLLIGGFSSNPGQSYLTSITISGIGTFTGASAVYSYGSVAQWFWFTGVPLVNGGSYTAEVYYS